MTVGESRGAAPFPTWKIIPFVLRVVGSVEQAGVWTWHCPAGILCSSGHEGKKRPGLNVGPVSATRAQHLGTCAAGRCSTAPVPRPNGHDDQVHAREGQARQESPPRAIPRTGTTHDRRSVNRRHDRQPIRFGYNPDSGQR